jgi:peroxiredoxin
MKHKIILFLFISNFALSQSFDEGSGVSKLNVGDKVPDFEFVDLENKSINFNQFKGKYVLINFFATWCAPCVKEMPLIENEIWKNIKNSDDFIILSFGRGHSNQEIKKFISEKGFTFTIYADEQKKIFNLFALSFIPRNYIIDKDGTVIYSEGGFKPEEFEKMKNKINTLLNK